MMAHSKINLLTLKPLHVIGKYLGIWPAFNMQTMEKCGLQYIYGIVALTMILTQYAYSLYGKLTYEKYMDTSMFVILILSDFTITLSNVTSIVGINFIYGNELQSFLQQMQNLEATFKRVKKDEREMNRNFYIELIITHVLFVIYMVYNALEWLRSLGWSICKYTLLRDVQCYHVFVTTLLIRNYVLLIKYKIQAINYVLQHHNVDNLYAVISPNASADAVYGKQVASVCQPWDLDFISAIYTQLSNVVNQFNDIFGWNFVFLHVNVIANLLMPLNLALVYGNGEEKLLGKTFDFNLLILCCIWFMMPLVNVLGVISACDRTKTEASKMPGICYNLILENKNSELCDKKLKDLAMQGHILAPSFTAAGFLNCDYSLVFPTFGTLISYVIVLIQFRS